ncbi:MAG: formylmethanofuran dehydrogenase subunit C [Planctomycetaceae bacterium]
MSPITLTLNSSPKVPLEAETVTPDAFVTMSNEQIRSSLVYHGKRRCRLDDFFEVTGEYSDHIEMHGDLHRVKLLGKGMSRGQLKVHGSVGMHLGADMRGGRIEVTGDAGDWIGAEMINGFIHVHGNGGGQIGAAYRGSLRGMRNGIIIVGGTAGLEVGMRMRRGTIVVVGKVRDFCGLQMKGGTIILMSGAEIRTGAWMVRGTILSLQPLSLIPTFVASGHYNPSFIDLYARELRPHGIILPNNPSSGTWSRHCGDTSIPGKGEILIWNPA